MLKVNLGAGNGSSVIMAGGTLGEISAEIAMVVADLYKKMKQDAPPVAEAFRSGMVRMMADPASPVWNGELKAGFAVMSMVSKKEGSDGADV